MTLVETLSTETKDIYFQLRIAQDTPAEREAALRRALQAGCRGLSSILLDPMFRRLYEEQSALRSQLGNESAIAFHMRGNVADPDFDFEKAVASFVQQEKQLLRAVGWQVEDAELIGEKLLNLIRTHVVGTPTDRSKSDLDHFAEIANLRNCLCQLDPAPDLGAMPPHHNNLYDWLSGLAHVATSLGGAVVLVANASAFALSHGLTAPLSELSKAAGGAIFVDSAKAAWKDLARAPRAKCTCKH